MPTETPLVLHKDRYFGPDSKQRKISRHLYHTVQTLPLICPHGHVDPSLFAENKSFGTPTELLVIPDHYLYRMLYSQGISLESLGIPRLDGQPVEQDHRKIWQIFGENFYLFRGTPTGNWLKHEFYDVFGIRKALNGDTAMEIYDQIADALNRPENLPPRDVRPV